MVRWVRRDTALIAGSGVDPVRYQPPLRWYSHLWRAAVMVGLSAAVWSPLSDKQTDRLPLLFWTDLALGVVSFVLVHFRRRWPLTIAVVISLLAPFSAWSTGPSILAVVSLATRRVWWQVVAIGLLNMPLFWVYYVVQPQVGETSLLAELSIGAVAITAGLGWGMYIGSRRELLYTYRLRAETAEAERDARAREARAGERARIAREMHDVLAHRISQISLHAGALSYREDLDADQMRESVAVIRAKAHEALEDLRGVLGVLRADDGDSGTVPQPTYADLPALVDSARAAGSKVEYDAVLPDGADVPDAVGRTLYRIVQEGITNAHKHAPGARLSVSLRGDPEDGIELLLRNPLGTRPSQTPGAGLGLVGLAERATLRGGRVDHAVEGNAFVLRAWLPWAA